MLPDVLRMPQLVREHKGDVADGERFAESVGAHALDFLLRERLVV